MKTFAAHSLLFLFVIGIGLSWPVNKVGLQFTSPSNFMELRFIFGTFAMFCIAGLTKNLIFPRVRDLPIILSVGFFQMALMMNCANYGLAYVPPGQATFLAFTVSVWIIPLKACINKTISKLEILSFFLGILGIGLLCHFFIFESSAHIKGYALLLCAGVFWAIGIVCAGQLTWYRRSIQVLPWQLLLAAGLTVVLARIQGVRLIPTSYHSSLIWSLVYTGICSIGLGYWILNIITQQLPASIISLGLLGVPIVSFGISHVFFDEPFTISMIFGIILLTVASLTHIYDTPRDQI